MATTESTGNSRAKWNDWISGGFKRIQEGVPITLPLADFPDRSAIDGSDVKQWATKNSNYNYKRIPNYVKDFETNHLDNRQALGVDVQNVFVRLLSAILLSLGSSKSYGTLDALATAVVPSSVSKLSPSEDTVYLEPIIDHLNGKRYVLFRIIYFDRNASSSMPFSILHVRFATSMFLTDPENATADVDVQINSPHLMNRFLNDMDNEQSISNQNRNRIKKMILQTFIIPQADRSIENAKGIVQRFSIDVSRKIASALVKPADLGAPSVGINFFTNSSAYLFNTAGQTPKIEVLTGPILPGMYSNSFQMRVSVRNVYYNVGSAQFETSTDSSPMNGSSNVFSEITELFTIRIEEHMNGNAILTVEDRVMTLRPRSGSTKTYRFFMLPYLKDMIVKYNTDGSLMIPQRAAMVVPESSNQITPDMLMILNGSRESFAQSAITAAQRAYTFLALRKNTVPTDAVNTPAFATAGSVDGAGGAPWNFNFTSQLFTSNENNIADLPDSSKTSSNQNPSAQDVFDFLEYQDLNESLSTIIARYGRTTQLTTVVLNENIRLRVSGGSILNLRRLEVSVNLDRNSANGSVIVLSFKVSAQLPNGTTLVASYVPQPNQAISSIGVPVPYIQPGDFPVVARLVPATTATTRAPVVNLPAPAPVVPRPAPVNNSSSASASASQFPSWMIQQHKQKA